MAKMVQVKVLRPFFLNSKPTKIGQIVEVPVLLAAELVTTNKAWPYEAPKEEPKEEKAREKKHV